MFDLHPSLIGHHSNYILFIVFSLTLSNLAPDSLDPIKTSKKLMEFAVLNRAESSCDDLAIPLAAASLLGKIKALVDGASGGGIGGCLLVIVGEELVLNKLSGPVWFS